MVKYHVITDRDYRYQVRSNKKELIECAKEICKYKIKSNDYYFKMVSLDELYRRSVNSYNFLYNQYSHLYEVNKNVTETLENSEKELTTLRNKYDNMLEEYSELKDKYDHALNALISQTCVKSESESEEVN